VVDPTIPGPLQLNVTPGVEELAEMVIDVLAQLSVPPVALAPGGTIWFTEAVAVLVQPPAEVVTVTV